MNTIQNNPEVVTTDEIATFLKVAPKTIYNYTSNRLWVDGIFLGHARYNLTRLKETISNPPYRYLKSVRDINFCNDLKI